MSDAPNDQSKPRGFGKVIKRTILLAVLVTALAATAVFFLAKSEPGYYKQHQQFLSETTPEQIQELVAQVDKKLEALATLGIEEVVNDAIAVTGQGPKAHTDPGSETDPTEAPKIAPEDVHINADQTIMLNNKQLAAIVQTQMQDWMDDRGFIMPEEVFDPMVAVNNGGLVAAFRMESDHFSAVISGKFHLNILDTGMAELTLDRFLVGSLPVPAEALSDYLYDMTGDSRMQQAGEWLGKLSYMQVKPVFELKHRRRARVMDYHVHDDEIELTLRIQDHKTYKAMNAALAGVPVN